MNFILSIMWVVFFAVTFFLFMYDLITFILSVWKKLN